MPKTDDITRLRHMLDATQKVLKQQSGRVLGLHKNRGWISEDFNAPLKV
ncbi:MAG: hypothetical protein F6K31_27675 [Symploca sp. SIO2G7]|nr:hypothetical protein [Symploca sp. SIO2G7]